MFDEEDEEAVDNVEEGEYDPHAHRHVPNPITYMESLNHIIKCSLSTGLLTMPQGFSDVGLAAGVFGSVLGGILVIDDHISIPFEAYLILFTIPCIFINLVEDLKAMAPVSLISNMIMMIAFFIYVYVVAITPRRSRTHIKMFHNLLEFPPFFGSLLFSVTSVGVVYAVENEMRTPREFVSPCGVLNFSMSILIVLHVLIGIMGYNYCRDKCTDNLAMDLPLSNGFSKVTVILFAIGLLLSFGLHCYVPILLIWKFIEHELPLETPKRKRNMYKIVIRVGLAICTFLLAIAIPQLHLFVSLLGAVCLSALALIFPAVMEAVNAKTKSTRYKDISIIVMGICLMFLGFYNALDAIVQNFMHDHFYP